MKNLITTRLSLFVCAAILLNSCGTSQDVSSNRMISKRKYTKGFHVTIPSRVLSAKTEHKEKEVIAVNEEVELAKRSVRFIESDVENKTLIENNFNTYSFAPAKETKSEKKQRIDFFKTSNSKLNAVIATEELKTSKSEKLNSSYSSIKQFTKKVENQKKKRNDDTVLLVILAFFIPPLAVYLYEDSWTKRCTINLILTLLCGLPGLIHALVVILGNK